MSDRAHELDKASFEGIPHGWIQWKGTDVCIDLHCECGFLGHYDGDFFYKYRCPQCKKAYAVGACVKLIPLTPEEEKAAGNIKTCELELDAAEADWDNILIGPSDLWLIRPGDLR